MPDLPTRDELVASLRRVLSGVPEIAAAYLFGSWARGCARADSDLDVGLVFRRRGETALDHRRLMGDLASRLDGLIPSHRVDLVVLESQGPVFCHQVLQTAILVHEGDRNRRLDFVSDSIARGLDFLPTYEIAARASLDSARAWLKATRDGA